MKALTIAGIAAALIAASAAYGSSAPHEAERPETAPVENFENLGLKKGESVRMTETEEEAQESGRQAVEGAQKQLEMSDPETRAAIEKAREALQKFRTQAYESTEE